MKRVAIGYGLLMALPLALISCWNPSPTSIPTVIPPTSIPTDAPTPTAILHATTVVASTPIANTPTSLSASTPQTRPASCGTVEIGTDGMIVNAQIARDAEECFLTAYQQCVPGAALSLHHQTSANTSVGEEFVLENRGGVCTIKGGGGSDVVLRDSRGTPYGHGGAPFIQTCTRLDQSSTGGLTFVCNLGNVDIPPAP